MKIKCIFASQKTNPPRLLSPTSLTPLSSLLPPFLFSLQPLLSLQPPHFLFSLHPSNHLIFSSSSPLPALMKRNMGKESRNTERKRNKVKHKERGRREILERRKTSFNGISHSDDHTIGSVVSSLTRAHLLPAINFCTLHQAPRSSPASVTDKSTQSYN